MKFRFPSCSSLRHSDLCNFDIICFQLFALLLGGFNHRNICIPNQGKVCFKSLNRFFASSFYFYFYFPSSLQSLYSCSFLVYMFFLQPSYNALFCITGNISFFFWYTYPTYVRRDRCLPPRSFGFFFSFSNIFLPIY